MFLGLSASEISDPLCKFKLIKIIIIIIIKSQNAVVCLVYLCDEIRMLFLLHYNVSY